MFLFCSFFLFEISSTDQEISFVFTHFPCFFIHKLSVTARQQKEKNKNKYFSNVQQHRTYVFCLVGGDETLQFGAKKGN